MNVYPIYKDSGIEWMGDIPNNWKLTKIDLDLRNIKMDTMKPMKPMFYH